VLYMASWAGLSIHCALHCAAHVTC